jgi:phosphohistidine phosphatase
VKQLLFCRHAKSSWKNSELADIDRPLNKRGKRNALLMGERLAARGMIPDCILSSPAKRAGKTAVRLCKGMNISRELIWINEAIYDSNSQRLLRIVSKADDCYSRLMLIGHNPELTLLVNELAQVEIYNVPTCGIAGFSIAVNSWQNVHQARAELLFFDYPKKQHSDHL